MNVVDEAHLAVEEAIDLVELVGLRQPGTGLDQGFPVEQARARRAEVAVAVLGILDDQREVPVGLGQSGQQPTADPEDQQPPTPSLNAQPSHGSSLWARSSKFRRGVGFLPAASFQKEAVSKACRRLAGAPHANAIRGITAILDCVWFRRAQGLRRVFCLRMYRLTSTALTSMKARAQGRGTR